MPYNVRKEGSKWVVVSKETGRKHGTHDSREKAMMQMRALYANVPDAHKKHSIPPRRE